MINRYNNSPTVVDEIPSQNSQLVNRLSLRGRTFWHPESIQVYEVEWSPVLWSLKFSGNGFCSETRLVHLSKIWANSLPSSTSKGGLPLPVSKAGSQLISCTGTSTSEWAETPNEAGEGGCFCVAVERIPVQGLNNKKQDESNVYFTGYVATISGGDIVDNKPNGFTPVALIEPHTL